MLVTAFVLAALLGSQETPPTPGGLPGAPSVTLAEAPALTDLGVEALKTRASVAAAELAEVSALLRAEPIVHVMVSPYFGITPFDATQNLELARTLRARLEALGKWALGDRTVADALSEALTLSTARLWACDTGCEDEASAADEARAALAAEEDRLLARVDAASVESALVLLQLEYLAHVRELLRVRVRRALEDEPLVRVGERGSIEVELPPWAIAAREQRLQRQLQAAEAARQKAVFLGNLESACRTLNERRQLEADYRAQVEAAVQRQEDLAQEAERVGETHKAYQERIGQLVQSIRAGDPVAEQFDGLHQELVARLDQTRDGMEMLSDMRDAAEQRLQEAQRALRTARGAVPIASNTLAAGKDPCAPENKDDPRALPTAQVAAAQAVVAQEEARAELHRLQLAEAEQELALSRASLASLRENKRDVLPYLSAAYRSQVFTYNAEYFKRMLRNLTVLLSDGYEHLRLRLGQLRALPTLLLTWSGLLSVLGVLLWLGLILIAGRVILRSSDEWIVIFWRWAKARRSLQPVLDELQSILTVLSVMSRPALRLAIAWVAASYIGFHHVEVLTIYIVFEWLMLYRILRGASRTLFVGPTWRPERAALFTHELDDDPALKRDPETARLSDRSLHLIIAYFIWRTAVLTTVDLLLGRDYLYHLCLDVVSVVQWMVIALLIVWWRERVAIAYVVHGPPFGRELVRRNGRRLWFALLALPCATLVFIRRLIPWLRETFGAAGPLRTLTNILSRRAMEQAAKEKLGQLGRGRTELPEDYQSAFVNRPLTDEAWLIAPLKPVQEIADLYAFWAEEKREGSVAIVGEAGMGKTTLINQVLRALPLDEATVLRGRPRRKLSTEADVIEFLTRVFGFTEHPPTTLAALEKAILDDPSPVVVIDDAHHFFLKTMGGMAGLNAFVHVVNVTSHNVFWITAFNSYSWFFIKNLKRAEPPFRNIVTLRPWSDLELEGLLLSRTGLAGYEATFQDLVIDKGMGGQTEYEVIKTAQSYFRLLGDLAAGNPAVAMRFWLNSLRYDARNHTMRVGLYNPDLPHALLSASDDMLFLLTCVAAHGSITPPQIAEVLRMPLDAVMRILAWCEENGFVERKSRQAVSLGLESYRQIIRMLAMRSFIYF